MAERYLRVVFDTNTLVSAALFPKRIPREALRRAAFETDLLTSSSVLAELEEVVHRAKFDKYISREERQAFFERYKSLSVLVSISERVEACRDPKDDKFLEVAVNGHADVIVTGDKDLLVLNPFRNTPIVEARAFLETFGET